MTGIKEVLEQLCSHVEPLTSAGLQQIYLLRGAAEANMAYDLFSTLGFDVKLYPENDHAKFYYNPAAEDPEKTQRKMQFAMAHAQTLAAVKQSADRLKNTPAGRVASYSITYTNPSISSHDKRIVLDLTAPESAVKKPAPLQPATVSPPLPPAAPRPRKEAEEDIMDDFSSGPEVAKKSLYQVYKEQVANQDEDSLYVQAINYLKSQRATTAFWVVIYAAGILVAYSFFVLAQAYLCPDLATVKLNHWYCRYD